MMVEHDERNIRYPFVAPLLAGAMAGLSVDVALYPLDTLKTRLQSAQGFQKAGGFRGVYRGLLTVAATSMPTSALFFTSYESIKNVTLSHVHVQHAPFVHMLAASGGEVVACLIRVPSEIAKQRKQTIEGLAKKSSISILIKAYKTEGLRSGVYRGFLATVARDLPFSFVELPIWEYCKMRVLQHNDGQITGVQSGLCGAVAGGIAAALTTPLDVLKTRTMLATSETRERIAPLICRIYGEAGIKGLFAGVTPRTTAFAIGGCVFFGTYDALKKVIDSGLQR